MMQQQPGVVVQPSHTMNVNAVRLLGIAQLVIGAITVLLGIGIVALVHGSYNNGSGLWGGGLFIVAGVLGIVSSTRPDNGCLNGCNMAFSIIAAIVSGIAAVIYIVAIAWWARFHCDFTECRTAMGLYVVVMLLTIAEFGVSIAASVMCCKANNGGCCNSPSPGVVIQQQPVMLVPGQQPVMMAPGQQPVMMAPGQQPVMMAPGQQPMYYAQQPQMAFNPQQQQPMDNKLVSNSTDGQPPYH